MLSKKPGQVSSVASRCLCMICGKNPQVRAEGEQVLTLHVSCCGQQETRQVSKDELVFTQRFFGEGDDGGDAAPIT